MSAHEALIARYENGVAELEDALRAVPEEMLDRAPAPGKWSIRQQAAHLADAELVMCARMRWIAAEPGTLLRMFNQDKWTAALHYERQRPEESLEVLRALRRATAAMLRTLPESVWMLTGTHEERGPVSLEKAVELCTSHCEHHVGKIRELRKMFSAVA